MIRVASTPDRPNWSTAERRDAQTHRGERRPDAKRAPRAPRSAPSCTPDLASHEGTLVSTREDAMNPACDLAWSRRLGDPELSLLLAHAWFAGPPARCAAMRTGAFAAP